VQQQFALEPIQLRLPQLLATVFHHHQRLPEEAQPFFGLSNCPIRLRQEGKPIRPVQLLPHRLVGGQPLAQPGYLLWALSPLLDQCPVPKNSSHCQPPLKSLLGSEPHERLGALLHHQHVPAGLMERGRPGQGDSQARGVRQLLGQCERLGTSPAGLVRIAQQPQRPGRIGEANDRRIRPVQERQSAVLLDVVVLQL
jgi:hypothetical protein